MPQNSSREDSRLGCPGREAIANGRDRRFAFAPAKTGPQVLEKEASPSRAGSGDAVGERQDLP